MKPSAPRIALAALAFVIPSLLISCSKTNPESPPTDTAPTPTPDIYADLLAEIKQLPIENDPSTALRLRHQPIPTFKDSTGEVIGMKSMTMEFPPAEGLSLAGLNINDKVRFTFEIVWDDSIPSWAVTKIEKIDPATKIDFTAP